MKGPVAISFVLTVLFDVVLVSANPGGYTAANDVLNLKLDDNQWAEAKRAGEGSTTNGSYINDVTQI